MKKIIFACACIILTTTALFPQAAKTRNIVIIGDKENQEQIYIPSSIKVGPDGNIYILDDKDSFIKVYSPDGKFLRKMGGEGYGPGLMSRTGNFNFSDDNTLFFTEMMHGNPWITFLKLSGKLDRTLKLNISGLFGIWRSVMLPDGRIIGEVHKFGDYERHGSFSVGYYPQWLAIINKSGKIEKSPIKKDLVLSIRESPDKADCKIPFFPEFLWAVDKNYNIIYSDGTVNYFQIFDFNGIPKGKIHTSLPNSTPVTGKDLDEWRTKKKAEIIKKRGNEVYAKAYTVIEKYTTSIHPRKPIYSDLSITPDGNLLVQGYIDEETRIRKYWLLDMSGKTLKEITTTHVISISISLHHIIFVKENEDDENRVCCYRRKSTETEDFNQKLFEYEL